MFKRPPTAEEREKLRRFNMTQTAEARAMDWSWRHIPHAGTGLTIVMNRVLRLRESLRTPQQHPPPIETFFLWALRQAVAAVPLVNSRVFVTHSEHISSRQYTYVTYDHVNAGIAMGLSDDQLVVPNIKHLEQKSFWEIHAELSALVERARTRKLKPADLHGGTITLNNTGAIGSEKGESIIVPGQVAILSTGAIASRVVCARSRALLIADPGNIGPMRHEYVLHAHLRFDHRLLKGVPVMRFLEFVKKTIEQFPQEVVTRAEQQRV